MNNLSLLDIQSPDHIIVNTSEGNVTVIVTKGGKSFTLGFPSIDVTKPQPIPTDPQPTNEKPTTVFSRPSVGERAITKVSRYLRVKHKLTEAQVREIKLMISDPEIISRFNTITKAYENIGRVYNVTGCAIGNIARGISWKHVTV
jgi:hypothetical protein